MNLGPMVQIRKDLLRCWDNFSKKDRKQLLREFIQTHDDLTGPELDKSLEHTAPLLLARLTASLRLTYLTIPESLLEQILAVNIFLKSAGGLSFVEQFVDVGGPLALLDIIALKQTPETCKTCALQTLRNLGDRGIRYKSIMCESNAIKVTTECLARSDDEGTRVEARELLLELGTTAASKKWCRQVYIAFIALLASRSPRANHLALGALRILQPVVGEVVPGMVEPLLHLFDTPHLEVLLEVCVFVEQLITSVEISTGVRNSILTGLVQKLRPGLNTDTVFTAELLHDLTKENSDQAGPTNHLPIPSLLGQAGCARCISMLIKDNKKVATELLSLDVLCNLLYAFGTKEHSESRRMAFLCLATYAQLFEPIASIIKQATGPKLYTKFYENSDCWAELTDVDRDILVHNKAVLSQAEVTSMSLV